VCARPASASRLPRGRRLRSVQERPAAAPCRAGLQRDFAGASRGCAARAGARVARRQAEIAYVGPARARLLFQAGLRTPEAVAAADTAAIETVLARDERARDAAGAPARATRRAAALIRKSAREILGARRRELQAEAAAVAAALGSVAAGTPAGGGASPVGGNALSGASVERLSQGLPPLETVLRPDPGPGLGLVLVLELAPRGGASCLPRGWAAKHTSCLRVTRRGSQRALCGARKAGNGHHQPLRPVYAGAAYGAALPCQQNSAGVLSL